MLAEFFPQGERAEKLGEWNIVRTNTCVKKESASI
jgi:L-rhamnose mutarotase